VSANAWVDRANAQVRVASRNLKTMNQQIDKMNALKNRIEGMLSAPVLRSQRAAQVPATLSRA
jgi:hypothetical protein